MNDFKFELDREGVRSLLMGAEMQSVLQQYGQRVASNTGKAGEYEVDTKAFKTRASVRIKCATDEALADNMKRNTLLKALGASND